MGIILCIPENLRGCFSKMKSYFIIARPNALELSPFRELPPELICLIANYLPIESVGSLSLSCLPLYSCLKMKYLQPLKEAEYSVMNKFLHLLERDLPAHIVCPHCNKLHYIPFAKRHRISQLYFTDGENLLKCRIRDSRDQYNRRNPGGFSSTIFRMVMKTHRQGKDTTALLRLLSYRHMHRYLQGFIELDTVEAQIRHDSLIMRDQKVFMVPISQKTPLPWYSSFGFCHHIPLIGMPHLYWWGIQIPQAHEIDKYENNQGIIYCPFCHTEFRIDFKRYGKAGNAVFITRWIDFGGDADDNGFKWHSKRGSICAAYEGGTEFKFDSLLTEQDKKDLYRTPYWAWPSHKKVVGKGARTDYIVRNGRFVPKFYVRK